MAPPSSKSSFIFVIIVTSAFVSSILANATSQHNEAYTSIFISQKGLDFLKDFLISQVVSSIIPLTLPNMEHVDKVPLLGNFRIVLSDTTIKEIDVTKSYVKPGKSGIVVITAGTTCNLNTNWFYEYSCSLFPLNIRDHGGASVRVDGMEVGLTLNLKIEDDGLKLILIDYGCYVKNLSITLSGGTSWFYQGFLDALQDQIKSAVENSISNNLGQGISKLNAFLKALPKEISVDETASLNVSIVEQPSISDSSIEFHLNGLFTPKEVNQLPISSSPARSSSVECSDPSKMLGISLDEAVFRSASALYYDAKFMEWVVDKIPNLSLLNTASWRFIIPQLYNSYPNDDMNLNITFSSPPATKISADGFDATVYADVVIIVLASNQSVPVACISLVIGGIGSIRISGNRIGGSVKLSDFSLSLKWSKIGRIYMNLVQPLMRTMIQNVFVPYANSRLANGFPLPIVHGFTLQDAEVSFSESAISVCGDVWYDDNMLYDY